MMSLLIPKLLLCGLFPAAFYSTSQVGTPRPNIIYVMCDDLGYGDVHCLAPETSKIPTPNVDQLAREGITFTDAHSGSSVCTPTRYGLLTGRYSWRSKLQQGVVTGFAPCLIVPDRPTVASFLKSQGYHTAIVGKWHLNFLYLDPQTGERYRESDHPLPPLGATIPDGPIHRGFDYFHGFHHARNMKAVIENDSVIAYDDEINMLPRLTTKSVEYIESRAKANADGERRPFFLYVPLGSPHTPILPSKAWKGKSGLGAYADFVMETEQVVGEISVALDKHGLAENTLLIFTSDNGCSRQAGIQALAEKGHLVSAHLRGSKSDIWDGGHRVPFIARWPGKIKPGSTSHQLICHNDLFATVAEITHAVIPAGAAEDSVSILPALSGQPIDSSRAGVIHHSISGHFAYRMGDWKLALAKGSGGWSSPNEKQVPVDSFPAQLYNMKSDIGEQANQYAVHPEIVQQLLEQLTADINRGRSTEGPESNNDIDSIILWKTKN